MLLMTPAAVAPAQDSRPKGGPGISASEARGPAQSHQRRAARGPGRVQGRWVLTFDDEFNAPDGSPVDAEKWGFALGGKGWGNNELETYTDRIENAHQESGNLVITVIKEPFTGADDMARDYTSARLNTLHKFSQQYGRFEARIKVPRGQGIWPAFWLLGANTPAAGWPTAGEIDIMENIGKEPATAYGTVHGPGYSGAKGISSKFVLPKGRKFADGFHVFAVEWERESIRFFVDGKAYRKLTPADLPRGTKWVYDHPFYILLNVAVGGDWPGNPDATSEYPQKMLVDYVRVYTARDRR